jgi:hypothetical protein
LAGAQAGSPADALPEVLQMVPSAPRTPACLIFFMPCPKQGTAIRIANVKYINFPLTTWPTENVATAC